MHRGIATVSLSGLLDDKLVAVAGAGFDGVEVFDPDLVASPASPAEVARRCADLGLSVDLFQPVRDVEGVPPERFAQVLHRVRRKLDVAAELGAPMVLACSTVDPDAIDDVDLSAEQLHAIGDLARERGVRIAFEALAWGRHANRLEQAWERVARADHPAVGLAVDTFHLLARGDGAGALDGVPGERIFFLQVADAPALDMNVLEWSRHHRCFPGQGTLDVVPVAAKVLEAGYRGPVSLEVFSDVVREAESGDTALDAYRSLLFLEDQLRRHWAHGSQPDVALFDAAPPPVSADLAFVEVAARHEADDLLTGLGFVRAGEHRSKPVTWWRNGDAHVVVNHTAGLDAGRPTAVGLVADPVADVAGRAEALRWPGAGTQRRAGDAPLPGVTSPSGVHVFVSGSPDTSAFWQRDFTAVEDARTAGWSGIDHIGTVVDEQHVNAEMSFHRGLFGLAPGPVTEFMEPQGRLRSRDLRPAQGGLRLVVNVADTRDGGPTGINQVAFGCRDLLAEVVRLRARGVELIDVPDNYYADLEARFELEPDLLASLREHRVLYDRVGDGELLHVYTPVLPGGFYVELLERRGGYDGYGSANTALRLALQAQHAPTYKTGPTRAPA